MNEAARLRALVARMRQRRLPALLITHLPDVRYLCGFTGSSAVLAVLAGQRAAARLFTDGRYTAQARDEVRAATVRIAAKSALHEACAYVVERGAATCGIDRAHVSIATLESMKSAVSGIAGRNYFKPLDSEMGLLREVKDAAEQARIRKAATLTCSLYEGMLTYIDAGMTELQVAAELEHRARLAGAEGMSFETIVAAGARSALPHARATSARLQTGDLLTLDFGIILDGYCSDMTRTVCLGYGDQPMPKAQWARQTEQRNVFEAVLLAQQKAVGAVRAGISCSSVDEAARQVLKQAGLAKWFSHSTGHGLGLEIHEGPRVAAGQSQLLQAGMVITIEPGAYLPGRFGVRIEDTVLVTDSGAEVLTPVHKAWMEL